MSVNTKFDKINNIIINTVNGDFTVNEFIDTFTKMLSNPDFSPGMNALWDFRNASLSSLSSNDLEKMIIFMERNIPQRGIDYKLAGVVSKDVDYGISRMFDAYAENLPLKKRVFRDYDEAIKWLS